MISDRATCALVDRTGTISWYCPGRFDASAIFASLLDDRLGGSWCVAADGLRFVSRAYIGRTSILQTHFDVDGGSVSITDWMPLEDGTHGIFRRFSCSARPVRNVVRIRPEFGAYACGHKRLGSHAVTFPKLGMSLCASHPIAREGDTLQFVIPQGSEGWAALVDEQSAGGLSEREHNESFEKTASAWNGVDANIEYEGPYERQVHDSVRALQQMTCAKSGGVVAAATTSLPEVIGGERNFDYRYVWTRDAGLIISAQVLVDRNAADARGLLGFVARAFAESGEKRLAPYYAVNLEAKMHAKKLRLKGYRGSSPVHIGNDATKQFQLDAHGNVLLAAKLVFDRCGEISEWPLVEGVADFVCARWRDDDNGIWEETSRKAYTSSKIFAARGLEFAAAFSKDPKRAARWRSAAADIRAFVDKKCLTRSGAFAVYAGSEDVDVTAAQYALWSYCEPDSPQMLATIAEIESRWSREDLYWRRLEEFDSRYEGAFLAASCWVAHYYAVAGNVEKSARILDAVCRFANDLGLFAEEAGVDDGIMLGNFPQTFVHSSFVCAANGLKVARAGGDSRIR